MGRDTVTASTGRMSGHRRRTPPAGQGWDNGPMPTRDQVMQALEAVIDPELHQDIVTLEMVRSVDIAADGAVAVQVSLTTPGCPIRSKFEADVTAAVRPLE